MIQEILAENLKKRQQSKEATEFLASEEKLHYYIEKAITPVATLPLDDSLNFIKNGGFELLLEIMEHPNEDINQFAANLLKELTEEDCKEAIK